MNGLLLNNLKSPAEIYRDEGILFHPKLFEGEELESLRLASERIMANWLAENDRTEPDMSRYAHSMRHLNDPRWSIGHPDDLRIILEAAADPRCLGPAEQVFRGRSLFRSTTLWCNPRTDSWEGNWHRDHQFGLPDEEAVKAYFAAKCRGERGILEGIQMQIALVDSDDIEYVPFSAGRYDSPEEYYFRCADDLVHSTEDGMPNAMRVYQRAGDAVIFNPAGLHRGRYHHDKPRRTLMFTYTPRDAHTFDQFSHQPWMLELGYLDGLSARCRAFFEDFIEVYGDSWVTSGAVAQLGK